MAKQRPDAHGKEDLDRVTVYLPPDVYLALKHLAVEERRPLTAIFEELAREYVERQQKKGTRRAS